MALATSVLTQARQHERAALQEAATPRALRTLPARLVPQAPYVPPPIQLLHSAMQATMSVVQGLLSAQNVRQVSTNQARVRLLAARTVILMLLRVHVLLIMRECARQAMKDMFK